jgi:hypothetical protein
MNVDLRNYVDDYRTGVDQNLQDDHLSQNPVDDPWRAQLLEYHTESKP